MPTPITLFAPTGVKGVTCVVVGTDVIVYCGLGGRLAATFRLMDGDIMDALVGRRELAAPKLASSGQQAFRLLFFPAFQKHVNLSMSAAVIGCHGLQEPTEQSHHGDYVLARLGELGEALVILDDPPVYVPGYSACDRRLRST